MSSANKIQKMVDNEVERQKENTESLNMMEYFKKMLPSEIREVAHKTARRYTQATRRRR